MVTSQVTKILSQISKIVFQWTSTTNVQIFLIHIKIYLKGIINGVQLFYETYFKIVYNLWNQDTWYKC